MKLYVAMPKTVGGIYTGTGAYGGFMKQFINIRGQT